MKKALIVLLISCLSILSSAYQIELRENEVWWPSELWNALWCTVTVKDSYGNFVRNLKAEDFTVKERAYGKNNELLSQEIKTFGEQSIYKFGGTGFWEKSTNLDKLDIVFFIDGTGSMGKHIDSIRQQLHRFMDRLLETGTDFRIFISTYETEDAPEWTVSSYTNRFFGPTMIEEIRKAIEEIDTAGEWWNLSWGYDAFLWSLNLDWRADARKVVVIITDVYTDSVYGPNWYFSSGCVTPMSAVDLAMRETGIELYYCQPDEENMAKTELWENYSPKVNIKVRENNFDKLAQKNPLVKRLSWPFDQSEIEIKDLPIVDSKYFFAWVSDWGKQRFVERVEVQITFNRTGESVSFIFYPLQSPDGIKPHEMVRDVKFILRDEANLTMLSERNVSVYFYKVMGDIDRIAIVRAMHQITDKNGILSLGTVIPGKYYYILYTHGNVDYAYEQLGYMGTGWVQITKDGVKPSQITAYTLGRDTEIYRMRGLLQELENLDISTDRMKTFANKAREWLDQIKKDGVTLVEIEAIKRFNVSLGAIINCAGYAEVVQNRSTEDLVQVVQKMINMLREAGKVAEKLESATHIFFKVTNLFIDIITGNWSGVAANLTIQELVEKFVNYIENELVNDIISTVEEKLLSVLNNPEKLLGYFRSHVENWVKELLTPEQIRNQVFDFVSKDLVYNNFTADLEKQVANLLLESQSLVLQNSEKYWDYYKRSSLIRQDFHDTRKLLMGDLFRKSYAALKDQSIIDNWGSVLIVFRETIPLIVEFIELFETRYPELKDVKKALETLYSVLDAIGTMTRTYEMALKINHLEDLQSRMKQIVSTVYMHK